MINMARTKKTKEEKTFETALEAALDKVVGGVLVNQTLRNS